MVSVSKMMHFGHLVAAVQVGFIEFCHQKSSRHEPWRHFFNR